MYYNLVPLFKLNMSNTLKKRPDHRQMGKTMDRSKNINDQSTGIFQSHSATLHLAEKVSHSLKSSSNCKYYGCCNSITNKDLTFHPEVHNLPFQLYPKNWSTMSRSKRQQWEMLTQNNRLKNQERTEAKLRQQENKLRQCTFSPNITQFQPTNDRKDSNIYEKLYKEASQRKRDLLQAQRIKIQKERKQLQSYQNKPDIDKWKSLNKQKFDLEPLYKRLEKVIQQKKRNKKMIAEKQEVNYPFHPSVNQNSKKISQKKGLIENVVDRLIQEYKMSENRKNQIRQNMEFNFKKQFTFSPAINNYFPSENIRVHREDKQNIGYSFIPQINPLSNLMMQDRINETNQQKIYRLYNASIIKKADKISRIQAQVYADCCFNPQINQISKQMNTSGHKHHLCEVKQPQSPTHRPSINQVSRLMSESKRAKSLDNIKKKAKQKQENYKKEMQYVKMKECSFNPRIKDNKTQRKIINSQIAVQDVAGFKQFYSHIEKAQQKQRQRKQIQEKIFHLQKRYDLRMLKLTQNPITTPFTEI